MIYNECIKCSRLICELCVNVEDTMKGLIFFFTLSITVISGDDVRLTDLDPPEAQQYIDSHDQSLHYAPKIDSNVPAVRYIGNQPQQVVEDIYLARQYHGQDGLGGYLYGYNIPDIAKTEKKIAGGDLTGAYNYKADTGDEIKVQYWDNGDGFRQIDNVGDLLKSKQVQDTPEVQAEKDKFFARWNEEAIRNQQPIKDITQNEPAKFDYQYQPSTYQQPGSGQIYQSSTTFSKGNPNQIDYTGSYSENRNSYSNPAKLNQDYVGSHYGQDGYPNQAQGQYQHYQQNAELKPVQAGQYQENGYSNPSQTGQYQHYQQNGGSNPSQEGQYQQQQESNSNYGRYESSGELREENGPPKGFFYNFDYPVGKIVQKDASVGDLHNIYSANKDKYEGQLNAAYHH